MKLPRLFALAWLLSFCLPLPAAVLSNVPASSLTTTNSANTNDYLYLISAGGANRKLPVGWVLNGTNLVPGTVNSNALDAATLAALAGGSGTASNFYSISGSATLTNTYNLPKWHAWAALSNSPAVVLSIGDSMAEAISSVAGHVQRKLVSEYGLGGAAQFNGLWQNQWLGTVSNGASYSASTVVPSNAWPFSVYVLPPGASVIFTNQQNAKGMLANDLGLAWLTYPNGGQFGIMASGAGGAFSNALTLTGLSAGSVATTTTNWTAGSGQTYRLWVTNGPSTNYLLGSWAIDRGQRAVVPVVLQEGGQSLSNFCAVGAARLNPVWNALNPKLALWHWKELGTSGSNSIAAFTNNLNSLLALTANWTNCEHVWLLTTRAAPTNEVLMQTTAENAYSLSVLSASTQRWHFVDLATDYNATNMLADGWFNEDSAGVHVWDFRALSTLAARTVNDLGLAGLNANRGEFAGAVQIGRNTGAKATAYNSLVVAGTPDLTSSAQPWPNGLTSIGPLGEGWSGIQFYAGAPTYATASVFGNDTATRVNVASGGTGSLNVNNTETALQWSSWGVSIGANAHPTGRFTLTNYSGANLGHTWRAGADGNLILSNSFNGAVLTVGTNGVLLFTKTPSNAVALLPGTGISITTNSAGNFTVTATGTAVASLTNAILYGLAVAEGISATNFTGNGAGLTNIPGTAIRANTFAPLSNATLQVTTPGVFAVVVNGSTNFWVDDEGLKAPVGLWGASLDGDGNAITNIAAGNITAGTLAAARLPGYLPNLATTGALTNAAAYQPASATLSNLAVTGALTNRSGIQAGSAILTNISTTGALTNISAHITAGSNITLTTNTGVLTIAASGGGSVGNGWPLSFYRANSTGSPQWSSYTNLYWADWDCTYSGSTPQPPWILNTTGSGGSSQQQSLSNHIGIWILTTLSSANGAAHLLHNNFDNGYLGFGRSQQRALLNIPALSTAGENFIARFGSHKCTTSTNSADGVGFRYNHDTNGGAWQCFSSRLSTETVSNTAVAVTAGEWVTLLVDVPADLSAANFYINGSLVAVITNNLPNSSTQMSPCAPGIAKYAGTTARTLLVDYLSHAVEMTTPR